MSTQSIAAIDIGSNSALMSIGKRSHGDRLELLSDQARITGLGRGVDATGELHADAVERTLWTLAEYAKAAHDAQARVVAVGTSALRDARNASEFLERAEATLGSTVEIIAGEREAELSFAGALYGLPFSPTEATVIDVGGGSTEIVRRPEGVLKATSLDIGAVRLTERFSVTAPTTDEQRVAVREHAREQFSQAEVRPRPPLVATAGTATTLAAVAYGVVPFDSKRIHGAVLSVSALDTWIDRLSKLDHEQRTQVPGLAAERADIIVVGALLLKAACEVAGARELRVSCGGVRIGLLLEALATSGLPIDPSLAHG